MNLQFLWNFFHRLYVGLLVIFYPSALKKKAPVKAAPTKNITYEENAQYEFDSCEDDYLEEDEVDDTGSSLPASDEQSNSNEAEEEEDEEELDDQDEEDEEDILAGMTARERLRFRLAESKNSRKAVTSALGGKKTGNFADKRGKEMKIKGFRMQKQRLGYGAKKRIKP
mmetsp:Transcript_143597/g.203098  ORF Transcript_143597/g.203098 Transcript_143597/m.203098 type:complete len:169 (-) Transcript_143597:237-743(-)